MNIATILHDQATRRGSQTAIVCRGRTVTFAELDAAASIAARDLGAHGVAAGTRALVLVPMSIDLYVVLIALFRLCATAVIVDPSLGLARLAACVRRVVPGVLIATPKGHLLRLLSRDVGRIPRRAVVGGFLPFARRVRTNTAGEADAVVPCDDDTPVLITFTSGSTGEPKAVVRTHGFLVAQHRALAESLGLTAGTVDLTTLPVFLLANLASGVTSVVPDADLRSPGAIDPSPVLEQVAASGVTQTVASPAFLLRLVEHPSAARALAGMQRIFTGGAPVFPATLDALAAVSPAADVVAVYGSTEAEPICKIERRHIVANDRDRMRGGAGLLAGRPVPSVRLAVVEDRWGKTLGPWTDEDLARATLAAGEAGEIIVSGDHVLRGYLDGHGDVETKIRAGDQVWHRTGDAGYVDATGRVWLLGRCSARVDDAHGRLYPFAVECAVSDLDGLRRSAFVGRRRGRLLVVELDEGADRDTVVACIRGRLAWARLAEVIVVPRIPLDARHNAKVDYPALERMIE